MLSTIIPSLDTNLEINASRLFVFWLDFVSDEIRRTQSLPPHSA